eukprot:scaffold403_cov127-Isochrysis_galbana.AAC.5
MLGQPRGGGGREMLAPQLGEMAGGPTVFRKVWPRVVISQNRQHRSARECSGEQSMHRRM